ncbi:carbohydrate kinase [uncultured Roseibium sp.]|uniref:carbohydrate kinase family protein n=1 Tax=uncultured Roseibium sp. TaxID=1936171 RepID=UPI0032180774
MILICGEALFDMFASDLTRDPVTFEAYVGGSPFNVAIGLARLGEDVAFFGGISTDLLGEKLIGKLRSESVITDHVCRPAALTTLSVVQKDANGIPAYTFYGEGAADRMVTEADLPTGIRDLSILHVGSYSALVEPVASSLKTLIGREKPNCLIAFDPNIRPTVVADLDLWRKNTEEIASLADIIKVSDEDLALIYPDREPAEIARYWLELGAGLVIVTVGAKGAEAFTRDLHVDVSGRAVTVIDTVGAGDTFQAALLSGLVARNIITRNALEGLDHAALHEIVLKAVNASALTCTRQGADLPSRDDVLRFENSC